MYKVLVVDDEPIILSGIQFLIDWNKIGCEIVSTARNGQDAYNEIKEKHPDIVLTDIKMPIMNGMELLDIGSREFPDIVFVILTSLEEFKIAKEAIKLNACDYLLKTELEPELLVNSIEKAIEEHKRRSGTRKHIDVDTTNREDVKNAIQNLFVMRNISPDDKNLLYKKQLLDNYAFIGIFIDYPTSNLEKMWKADDYKRLYNWEGEVIRKIIPSNLKSTWAVLPTAGKESMFIYFVPNINPGAWFAIVQRIKERVANASELVTGLKTEASATKLYSGKDSLEKARQDFEMLSSRFYLDKPSLDIKSLDVDEVFPKIERDIKKLDLPSLQLAFKRIRDSVATIDHTIAQISFVLKALQSAIHGGLVSIGSFDEDRINEIFSLTPYLTRRESVLLFLDDISAEIKDKISSLRGDKQSIITDNARSYILEHVTEHISLSDVAEYACVSPGYMSQFFKKNMGISIVDYINQMKVQRAKEIMTNGSTRINEIALSLGYDNIYYFSKVFKKVTGITPTEYISRGRKKNGD